jgi:RNA polymerase sigma-B factor
VNASSAADRDERLFERYRDPADPVDREALMKRFMPLARQLAARFARGKEPYDDILQVASLALLGAIDRFDPARRVAFSSFATPTMVGAIKRHFRDTTWAVRVPRDLKERALAVDDAGRRLTGDHGRPPSLRELAEAVHAGEEQVREAQLALDAYTTASLETWGGDDDTRGDAYPEALRYDDPSYDRVEQRVALDRLLALLSRREREVLRLRFEEDLCQREIGERIGVSQMHVSRILRGALETLSELAEDQREAADAPPPRRTPVAAAH